VTVFNDRFPAVANLDPELLRALRQAATDAADDGVAFYVNSGWRSAEYQNRKAIDRGCPQMYADPAQDPRMQQ
jgi:LAS superfamily LD-carboxypeptidase LdcB